MSVNFTASVTVTSLGAATVGLSYAAATAASTTAVVAYATFATLGVALSLASITALFDPESQDASSYFTNVGKHAQVTIPGVIQFVAQAAFQALVEGLVNGISRAISDRIGGPQRIIVENR